LGNDLKVLLGVTALLLVVGVAVALYSKPYYRVKRIIEVM